MYTITKAAVLIKLILLEYIWFKVCVQSYVDVDMGF